ncbi:MAG TPA: type II toxin-antitoxin system VapC family toxin [Novimethylophilus sp.]|jgi:tRNA(fMet)-specific endonuclease VapC|uniref:type II toxin-antitoxin system tRNA(fMet)-specific endonuclease VapC n=1 Tax=Novimethylophilus sp. TaxID=2137426 RepID=UPI002F415DDF
MKLMLDTNTCIAIIKRKPVQVLQKFNEYQVGDIGVSSVTLAELRYGVAKSQHQAKNQAALDEFMLPLEVAPFDESATAAYGAVRALLEKQGTPIGPLDTMIGAHALSLGVTLVTNNMREFNRVGGLVVVDWVNNH